MAKQKQSNYRRYVELCQEDVKQSSFKDDTQFGPEYIIMGRAHYNKGVNDYFGYLTHNTDTNKFEFFIKHDGLLIQKTSVVEGNFWRVLHKPEIMPVIVEKLIKVKEIKNEI